MLAGILEGAFKLPVASNFHPFSRNFSKNSTDDIAILVLYHNLPKAAGGDSNDVGFLAHDVVEQRRAQDDPRRFARGAHQNGRLFLRLLCSLLR